MNHLSARAARISVARASGTHSAKEWRAMLQVCGSRCLRCGSGGALTKDHITPIYQGGSDAIENLQPLCQACNSSKGANSEDFRPPDWRDRLPLFLTPDPQSAGGRARSASLSAERKSAIAKAAAAARWKKDRAPTRRITVLMRETDLQRLETLRQQLGQPSHASTIRKLIFDAAKAKPKP